MMYTDEYFFEGPEITQQEIDEMLHGLEAVRENIFQETAVKYEELVEAHVKRMQELREEEMDWVKIQVAKIFEDLEEVTGFAHKKGVA